MELNKRNVSYITRRTPNPKQNVLTEVTNEILKLDESFKLSVKFSVFALKSQSFMTTELNPDD